MKRTLSTLLLALAIALPGVAQKQPQPKSQAEVDALMAIQNAASPDDRIAASEKLLTDFADTEFKEMAYYMMMASYQQKNDFENMLIFGEKTLEENAENLGALLSLCYAIPVRTREFDLDKEEKLSKAESYAQRALRLIPTQQPPNPTISDEEWLLTKKDLMSQAHEALATIALKREDYPRAEEELRQSLQVASQQEASTFYKLAQALKEQGKRDEAIEALDKCIEKGGQKLSNGSDAAVLLKAELVKAKESGAAPAADPAGSVPQVEIVPEP